MAALRRGALVRRSGGALGFPVQLTGLGSLSCEAVHGILREDQRRAKSLLPAAAAAHLKYRPISTFWAKQVLFLI